MSHTQFTQTERISLATLLRAGHIKADCARELSKDPSAVGREIKTNKDEDGVYRGAHAHKRAMARRKKAKRSARKIANNPRLQRYIIRKLKKHWSPEQIA
jgi:IS30 family transposase